MKFWLSLRDLSGLALALQWAYMLMAEGYERMGFIGGALGLILSPALLPISPFAAWYFFPVDQVWWFYGFTTTLVIGAILAWLLTPRITSDYPSR